MKYASVTLAWFTILYCTCATAAGPPPAAVAGDPPSTQISGDVDAATTTPTAGVDITFLMNEGFLIRSGNSALVIDAFLERNAYGYGAVPATTLDQLTSAAAPYDLVQLALVSHAHADHFQPAPAKRFLEARENALLLGSQAVIDQILDKGGAEGALSRRVRAVMPEPNQIVTVEHAGIRVDIFRTSHGGQAYDLITNLGMILHIGGQRILHVGDAHQDDPRWPEFQLPTRDIDIAILPFWMFTDPDKVRKLVGAKHWIPAHMKPGQAESLEVMFQRDFPEAILFKESGDTRKF